MVAPFVVTELSPVGAAEIVGLDASRPLDPPTFVALRAVLRRYPIIAMRDQHLTPRQQVEFSRQFGELEEQLNAKYTHPEDPLVLVLSNDRDAAGNLIGVPDAGDALHSDSSTKPAPCRYTILHAIANPSRGGQTEFINTALVYEALPAELRAELAGRFAYHDANKLKNPRIRISPDRPDATSFYEEQGAKHPAILQPVVRTHPDTGRQALFVSPRFTLAIDGMEPEASEALLVSLFAMMKEARFRYVHTWHDGDLVMWDNRTLNHRAMGGYVYPDVRRMHRTSVCGEPAVFVASDAGRASSGAES
jgi:taurine dioxygenase